MGAIFSTKADTGSTLYAIVVDLSGNYYNRSTLAFETLASAHLDNYAADLTEPGSLGEFFGTFPTLAAGTYRLSVRLRVGGSRAWTDYEVAGGLQGWTGTALAGIAAGVPVDLPSPAPTGYGPSGDGSVSVNHNYPTANNLTFQTSLGVGIGGAVIRAYLAAAYTLNPITAVVQGLTTTASDGTWANPMYLDPGAYSIVFVADGYLPAVVSLTVT